MGTNIKLFCSSCALCQVTKDSNQKPSGLLHSLPVPDQPWQSIGMDFMGPLPKSKGYDYLLVIIDHLMLQVHLVPMDTHITSKEVTWLFLKEVVRLHRVCYEVAAQRYSNSGTRVGNSGAKVFWTLASARALRLPSIASPGISNGSEVVSQL